jgi:hypothetical protein
MEITDSHIKLLKSAAQIDEAIEACYKTLRELATFEADIQAKRLTCKRWLIEMLNAKMILDSHRDL